VQTLIFLAALGFWHYTYQKDGMNVFKPGECFLDAQGHFCDGGMCRLDAYGLARSPGRGGGFLDVHTH